MYVIKTQEAGRVSETGVHYLETILSLHKILNVRHSTVKWAMLGGMGTHQDQK